MMRRTKWRFLQQYRYVKLRWRAAALAVDLVGYPLMAALLPGAQHRNNRGFRGRRIRKILIVQLDHLGDAVLTLPLIEAINSTFRDATVDVVCGPWNRELYESLAAVRHVYCFAGRRFDRGKGSTSWHELIKLSWRLRKERYDFGMDVRGDPLPVLLLWLADIRQRVGWRNAGLGFLLTHAICSPGGIHELSRRGVLLNAVRGCDRQVQLKPRISIPTRLIRQGEKFWHDAHVGRRIVCHIGAGTEAKRWPCKYWCVLIRRLLEKSYVVALVGNQAEVHTGWAIESNIRLSACGREYVESRLINAVGKTSLEQLLAVVGSCDVFIGCDSGPAHIAAMLGKETIVLFSGAVDYRQWHPVGPYVSLLRNPVPCSPCYSPICAKREHSCMQAITPEMVWDALQSRINADESDTSLLALDAKASQP